MRLQLIALIMVTGCFAHAQSLDSASQQANTQTQDLLKSADQRNAFIQKDSNAKAADDKLKAIPGMDAAAQQRAYEIAAQIMNSMVQQTGGDVKKQQALMEQAANDPQTYLNSLPADQRKQIEDLAAKTQAKSGK